MGDRAKISKHTMSMVNPGNKDLVRADAELWVTKLETILQDVLRILEKYQASHPEIIWVNEGFTPHVDPECKKRFACMLEVLQQNVFFKSIHGYRANFDALIACWATMQACGDTAPSANQEAAQMDEQPPSDHVDRPQNQARSDPTNIPVGARGSYSDVLQRPQLHPELSALASEVYARNLLPAVIKMAEPDVLQHAVQENMDAILSNMAQASVLRQAAAIIRNLLIKHTTENARTTLQSIGNWTPDDDPEEGVQHVYDMLLACVSDESVLDAQGRLRQSAGIARRRMKNRRTCNVITQMMLRCTDETYCGPQAGLGILLNDHLPKRIMQFLSTMRLTMSPSGLQLLLNKFREFHMKLTGMCWEDLEKVERTRLQLVPLEEGKKCCHLMLVTADNINFMCRRPNEVSETVHVERPIDILPASAEEVQHLLEQWEKILCGCYKTDCSTMRCVCMKMNMPCSPACKKCRGRCRNAITMQLIEYMKWRAKSLVRALPGQKAILLPVPLNSETISTSKTNPDDASGAKYAAGVCTTVGPVWHDYNEYTADEYKQTMDLSCINPEDVSISTHQSKHGQALVDGFNDFKDMYTNRAFVAVKKVMLQESRGTDLVSTGEKSEDAMGAFRRLIAEAGLEAPGADVQVPEDIEYNLLARLAEWMHVHVGNNAKDKSKLICRKIRSILWAEKGLDSRTAVLREALDTLYPGYSMDANDIPIINLPTMNDCIREAMSKLHESDPWLYVEVPAGFKRPKDVRKYEDRLIQWWNIHKDREALQAAELNKENTTSQDDDDDGGQGGWHQGTRVRRMLPVQRTGEPVVGDSGTTHSLMQVFKNMSALMPKDKAVTDTSAPHLLSKHYSCPVNMESSNIISATQNFWRGTGYPSDMLKGDAGKTKADAAALDSAKICGNTGNVSVLGADEMEKMDDCSDEDINADNPTYSDRTDGEGISWLAMPGNTRFSKCRNVQYSEDMSMVTAEVWDTKSNTWKAVSSVKATYLVHKYPTFTVASKIAIENPELTKLRPDFYERDWEREPPWIAVDVPYNPVPPKKYLSEPRDVLGDDPHILIFCADMGELTHVFKVIAQGKLRGVMLAVAGLHLLFKVGLVGTTRALEAIDLNRLLQDMRRGTRQTQCLPTAYEHDLLQTGQDNNAMSGGLLMLMMYDWIMGKLDSGEWTEERLQELFDAVTEGDSGDMGTLFKEYMARECPRDNELNAVCNYASSHIVFNMLFTAARTQNVDMMEAALLLCITELYKSGACPIYAMAIMFFHVLKQISPPALSDIVLRSLARPYRSDGQLPERGKSFKDKRSVGGMFCDEIQETEILKIKSRNPANQQAIKRCCVGLGVLNMVEATFAGSEVGLDKKHKQGIDASEIDWIQAFRSCRKLAAVKQLFRSVISDNNPSQRDNRGGCSLASVTEARIQSGHPASWSEPVQKPTKPRQETHSVPMTLVKALRASGKKFVETEVDSEGRSIKLLCAPYSDCIGELEKYVQSLNSEKTADQTQTEEGEEILADYSEEGLDADFAEDQGSVRSKSSSSNSDSDDTDKYGVEDAMHVEHDDIELLMSMMNNILLEQDPHRMQEDLSSPKSLVGAQPMMSRGEPGTKIGSEELEAGANVELISGDQTMMSPTKGDVQAGAPGDKRPLEKYTTGFTPAKIKAKQDHELAGSGNITMGAASGRPVRNKPKKLSADYEFSDYTTGRPRGGSAATTGDTQASESAEDATFQRIGTGLNRAPAQTKKKAARSIGKDWQGQE